MKNNRSYSKQTVYDIVTQKIIDSLEKGVVPWKKPWLTGHPQNISGRRYTGINRLLLDLTEYRYPYFLTPNQIQAHGGLINRREEPHLAVFWKFIEKHETDIYGDDQIKKIPYLRYYKVYNIEQTNLPLTIAKHYKQSLADKDEPQNTDGLNAAERARELVASFTDIPVIEYNWGDRACYIPAGDKIRLPYEHFFVSPDEFYSTKFHELVHSTGHSKRLNRQGIQDINFGSHEYSKEELIAEIGSCFLCEMCGMQQHTFENAAGYIQNWIKALNNDKRMIVHAAAQAEKAVGYLVGNCEEEVIETQIPMDSQISVAK